MHWRRNLSDIISSMNEHQQQCLRRFKELADRSAQGGIYTYSSFHSVGTASLAYDVAPEKDVMLWGGAENSERVVIRFGDPEEFYYEEDFPIRILRVSPKLEKFSETLTHRDFLGAILNLGIERDMIGDILVHDNSAYFFILEKLADLVCSDLIRVKHTSVKCNIVSELPEDFRPKLMEENISVSSPRLDSVIAKVFHLSRGDAKELFDSEKVTVNGRLCLDPETRLKENSRITVRGCGKFEYRGEGRTTKKGKVGITVWRYV